MSSGVEFDEDSYGSKSYGSNMVQRSGGYPGTPFGSSDQPRMVRFLMRHGIAKTPAVAQAILIGVVVVDLIITYIVIKYFLT